MRSSNNKKARIVNLVCVAETEKSYGVLPQDVVMTNVDPKTITHRDHLKNRFEGLLMWLPKSQLSNVKMYSSDIFPNLKVSYPSKFNQNLFPYKTQIDADIPEWLATEKKLIAPGVTGENEQGPSGSGYNDSW